VTTSSTKSRGNARRSQRAAAPGSKRSELPTAPPAADLSTRSWLIAAGSIFAVGAFLRLYDLALVPLHHDEGVNGNFLVRLVRDGFYHYDPANYHGPTLYYFSAIIPWTIRYLFGVNAQNAYGLTTWNIRLVPALFGLGTIGLVLSLRRQLGTICVLAAAALLAVSPGAVYLSRYFIHESLFVFFTFGIVVAGLRYHEERHPVYLILLAASAGLLFATKETWIISVGVLIIALASTHIYRGIWRQLVSESLDGWTSQKPRPALSDRVAEIVDRFGGPLMLIVSLLSAIAVCVAIGLLFYSSFGTNWKGVGDSVKTFEVWTRTGRDAHVHLFLTYVIRWLPYQESPVLFLGVIGFVLILLKPKNAVVLFVGLWAFGITAAYSLVHYKTPWLLLNFVVPLALISGYAFEWLYQQVRAYQVSWAVGVLAVVALWFVASGAAPNLALFDHDKPNNWMTVIPGYQTLDLNFQNYDNDNDYYVYVYAHSRRDLIKLVDDVNRVAQRSAKPGETGITIVSNEYWPLPWYFRDYQRVGYYGVMSASSEPVIIARDDQRSQMQASFGGRYRLVESGLNDRGTFALRPGVDLLLYVRNDFPAP